MCDMEHSFVSIWGASYSLEKNSGFWQFPNTDLSPILIWIHVFYFSKEMLIWVYVGLGSFYVPI